MNIIRQFLKLESASSIVLLAMAVMALLMMNSPWASYYQHIFQLPFEIQFGSFVLNKPFIFWIDEGLMSLFFLLIGLELKREFLEGELSDIRKITLPAVAAVGGMLMPALFYVAINFQHHVSLKGWAVPVATDIAFAVGVISFFGKRIPQGLKLFLLMLAIFDDVGAIIIIAVFYGHGVSFIMLLFALLVMGVLALLKYFRIRWLLVYIFFGVILWGLLYSSGVHPALSGVLLALMIPMQSGKQPSPLHRMESLLHPWVAYFVMPLFAFANAGISFAGVTHTMLFSVVTLGIAVGLFLGKQIGVMCFTWVMIKFDLAKLPQKTGWLSFYGMALLCGIGFTMSLFLGTLAFQDDSDYMICVRLGVLIGSLLSAIAGALVLNVALNKRLL